MVVWSDMTIIAAGGLIFIVVVMLSGIYTVDQQTVAVVEQFHAFNRLCPAGLHWRIPLFERVATSVDLKVQQMFVTVETKTRDDVTLSVKVAVQYFVAADQVFNAFYKLEEPRRQINAYVFDAIRAHVPGQTLDQVYANKELDQAIEHEVREKMQAYGYSIIDAPVVEIVPDARVKEAMNQVNANQRLMEAAKAKAEADKILVVKAAEAEAESKALQGDGIARERLAIARGLKESAELFERQLPGVSTEECMSILLLTQYFDMLKEIGARSNTIMLPHSPGGLQDLISQIRSAIIAGNESVAGIAANGISGPPRQ
jgi:regulator of protease activity HflC (stomatin/prohibitin superfamily)